MEEIVIEAVSDPWSGIAVWGILNMRVQPDALLDVYIHRGLNLLRRLSFFAYVYTMLLWRCQVIVIR